MKFNFILVFFIFRINSHLLGSNEFSGLTEFYEEQMFREEADFDFGAFDSESTDGSGVFSIDKFSDAGSQPTEDVGEEVVESHHAELPENNTTVDPLDARDPTVEQTPPLSYEEISQILCSSSIIKKINAAKLIISRIRPDGRTTNVSEQKAIHHSGITEVIKVLIDRETNLDLLTELCKALACLAYKRKEIQASCLESVPRLVSLGEMEDPLLQEAAIWALYNIISISRHRRERAGAYGLPRKLKQYLQADQTLATKRRAAGLISNLARDPKNREALGQSGIIPLLVSLSITKLRRDKGERPKDVHIVRELAKIALKELSRGNSINRKTVKLAKHEAGLTTTCCC